MAAAAEEIVEQYYAPPPPPPRPRPRPRRWAHLNVPPGYRFKPTPQELIQYYLEPWVFASTDEPSPGKLYGIMDTADMYVTDPGTLTSCFEDIAHDDGNWYFLCVSRWKNGTRMNRVVGPRGDPIGKWHGSGKRLLVPGHGYRQSFEYHDKRAGKTSWLMEEITTFRSEATSDAGVKMICRVHPTPRPHAGEDGDERQQQLETNVPLTAPPVNKRQRRRRCTAAPPQQVENHLEFDVKYWMPALAATQQVEAVPVPVQPHLEFDVNYCTPAPAQPPQQVEVQQVDPYLEFDMKYSTPVPAQPPVAGCFYATTSSSHQPAAAPPAFPLPYAVVGCSYAATMASSSQQAAAPPVTGLMATEALATTWQQQPMMTEQGDEGYRYCAGQVHGGGVGIRDQQPQPLENVQQDMGMGWLKFSQPDMAMECQQQQLSQTGCHYKCTAEDFQLDEVLVDPFAMDFNLFLAYPEPADGGVQENGDPKPEPGNGQENDDPKSWH